MPRKTLAQRFWEKVDKSGDCWLWTSYIGTHGYGVLNVGNVPQYAHRLRWKLAGRQIPENMQICHKCDTRSCVRLSHLFIGTAKDNNMDMWAKGRAVIVPNHNSRKTACQLGHPLDGVVWQKEKNRAGYWRRFCVQCKKAYDHQHHLRRKSARYAPQEES